MLPFTAKEGCISCLYCSKRRFTRSSLLARQSALVLIWVCGTITMYSLMMSSLSQIGQLKYQQCFNSHSVWFLDGRTSILVACIIQFIGPYYGVYRGNNLDDNIASICAMLSKVEDLLKQNGNFLFGDKPLAADYLIWPHVERLPGGQMGVDRLRDAITKEKFPVFYAWMNRMMANEAVKGTCHTPEQHYNFMEKFMSGGEHVYDLNMKEYTIYARKP